ncbi:MAG: hypothetical protein ACRC62_30850 [Microcoleus sp.]
MPVIKLSAGESFVGKLTAKYYSQQRTVNCTFNPFVGKAFSSSIAAY